MNIPYAAFYKAETTGNDTKVDAFTSATKNKTRTKGLAGGSYHENADGSKIDGITYAVKVDPSVDLSKYKEVKDGDSVEITVTNRGQTTTTTLTGKDTLFENASYAYYPLTEAPENYKEVSVDADGNLVFSEVKGQEATKVEGVTAELSTKTSYGDYELDLDGLPEEIKSDNVNAVVVKTTDGTAYGMRHLENIWRGNEIAWSTGFTSEVHGCPTSSEHYKSMMGKTIDSIEYYTTNGVYTMDIADIYVPVKSETTKAEVADADITAGKTTINVQLPDEFKPKYSVDGLDVSVEGNVLTFKAATESRAAASVKPGKYTLTIKDKNKKYADVVTTTTHKTLRGPRGGMILCNQEAADKYNFNKAIFPGIQGGPLMHVIAGKAICFKEALEPEFKTYAKNIIDNAKALADGLLNRGFNLVSGGTDNHLMLVDLRSKGVTGKATEKLLDTVNITCNKNAIPNDPEKPFTTSGIRLGTAAVTTRGFNTEDIEKGAEAIALAVSDDDVKKAEAMAIVKALTDSNPLY